MWKFIAFIDFIQILLSADGGDAKAADDSKPLPIVAASPAATVPKISSPANKTFRDSKEGDEKVRLSYYKRKGFVQCIF